MTATRTALVVDALSPAPAVDATRTWTAAEGGAQLRCCLRHSHPGERIALVAVTPDGPRGACRETGPVLLHADSRPGRPAGGHPDGFRGREMVFRLYDGDGSIAGGEVVPPGDTHEEVAARLLDRPGAAFVQVRNVGHGCHLLTIRRGRAPRRRSRLPRA